MRSLDLFNYLTLAAAIGLGNYSISNRNDHKKENNVSGE
jgi:hypothetical protein